MTECFDRSVRGLDYNAAQSIAAQVQANYARRIQLSVKFIF